MCIQHTLQTCWACHRAMYIPQSWPDPFQPARLLDGGQSVDLHSDVLILKGQAAPQTQESWLIPSEILQPCILSCLRVFAHILPFPGNSFYPVTRMAAVEMLIGMFWRWSRQDLSLHCSETGETGRWKLTLRLGLCIENCGTIATREGRGGWTEEVWGPDSDILNLICL